MNTPASLDSPRPVILCVDDEPSILSALRRLFRTHGFTVLACESGQAGLDLLEREAVDLVISDMRMPHMDGVAFLEQVRQRKPDILRLLLTGYADIASITGAINRGEIYRYIAKPWDDNDIILTVRDALERSALLREKKRLEALVLAQNEELRALNAGLERTVEARTAALQHANEALHSANGKLKNNFLTSIKLFTALIEQRDPRLAGHTRRVADTARRLALALAMDNKQAQEVFVAGLLYAIGMVGCDDALLQTPVASLTPRQLEAFRKHPARAGQLLMPLAELKPTLDLIGAQLEHFDGSGYPNGSSGRQIALGARILAVARDFDCLQIGTLEPERQTRQQALDTLRRHSGHHYDPQVVDALLDISHGQHPVGGADGAGAAEAGGVAPSARSVRSGELASGMVLSQDLTSPSGLLLLTAGHVLDDAVIRKIHSFEHSIDSHLVAKVWFGAPAAEA